MPNPDEPQPRPASPAGPADDDAPPAEQFSDLNTEVLSVAETSGASRELPSVTTGERRFTAPSAFDARLTQIIAPVSDPATEILQLDDGATASNDDTAPSRVAVPQSIPPRDDAPTARRRGRWGWVLAVVLVIAAIAAVAILATMLVSRADRKAKAERLQQVRDTIQNFDGAIQRGDLAALRGITCGETAEIYNNYDDRTWTDIHTRVAAARQYPVVASVDEVVVNGDHAEANVTSFMASDPATRSTRSFDLQFRDEQWKICQTPGS
jgi:type II secretory pathway pseudopilin PulG